MEQKRVGIYAWQELKWELPTIRDWILHYSDRYPKHRKMIRLAFLWLEENEPKWNLPKDEKINKQVFIEELLMKVSKENNICKHENLEEIDLDEVVRYKCLDCGFSWKEELPQ